MTLKDGGRPPLIIIHPDDRKKLVDATTTNLRTIFRATGLSRLAAASDYKPEDVDVQFQVKRRDGDGLEPLQASVVPRVSLGDEVHVLAKNCSDQLVDINVLYVGSDYSITHIVAERLAPQATLEIGADILLQRYDADIPRDHRHRLGQDAGRHPFQPR
ncbi:hypothetical protein NKI12_26320 [Mesorhizobium australicum]|uniref:Uncharacterized protein n=1 Tax=Mesorhizobium australicum TaxID=536018 RepID=A0ACC6T5M9_9HYPH